MPHDDDCYDFFVSYAREDDRDGWISRFVERLLAEHQRVRDGRPPLKPFFDTHDIPGLDDWRLRIHDSLAKSCLLLAFVSPTYFTRPWCRREWRAWIDHEIALHILSSGAAPIHIVEVPGLTHQSDERQVAQAVAALCRLAPPHEPFVDEAAPVIKHLRRRQLTSVQPFFARGPAAFDRAELRTMLANLARDLDQRIDKVRRAAASETNVPPYNRRFSGRLDELFELQHTAARRPSGRDLRRARPGRDRQDRVGVHLGSRLRRRVSRRPVPRIPCEGQSSLRQAVLRWANVFATRSATSSGCRVILRGDAVSATASGVARTHPARDGQRNGATLISAREIDALTAISPQLHLLAAAGAAATSLSSYPRPRAWSARKVPPVRQR
jgi:hypothetical protein